MVAAAARRRGRRQNGGRLQKLTGAMQSAGRYASSTVQLGRAALVEQQLTMPFRAPRTMLNVPIGGARRCAAQSWSLDRIKAVKNAAGRPSTTSCSPCAPVR